MALHVETPNFTTAFEVLDPLSVSLKRDIHLEKPTIRRTILPAVWVFAMGHFDGAQMRAWQNGATFGVTGSYGAFLPPFSLVEWHFVPGTFSFTSLFSVAPLPAGLPTKAVFFPLEPEAFPKSSEAVIRILAEKKGLHLGLGLEPSAAALKLKKAIDENYMRTETIAELSQSLEYSHAFLTRQFQKSFRVSPVRYRNELRVVDAFCSLLLSKNKVKEMARSVGFQDLSQFHRQFKRVHQASLSLQGSALRPRILSRIEQ